jgi:hypothetical protein
MATSSKTTQDFVPIREIRDGIVILKDGSMRALVLASSLNFALKSADEQNSIIYQFQNFLNSLDFSVQIFVQSKRLDIRPYIALLEERYKEQVTELMKIQTREYIEFIKTFVENSNIMTKSFFIIIPTDNLALVEAEQEIQDQIMKLLGFDVETEDNEEDENEEIDTTALAEFEEIIEGVDTNTQHLLKQWVTKYLLSEDESEVATPLTKTETTEV